MKHKTQLKHPRGKKPVRMDTEKYTLLKSALLDFLSGKERAAFGEMSTAIAATFRKNKTHFEGSLPWHLEWVKLDLEARKLIRRVPGTSPQQYTCTPPQNK